MTLLTQVARLLADMFYSLNPPEHHREWDFGFIRVIVETKKPVYYVNEAAVQRYEIDHGEVYIPKFEEATK